MNDDFKTLGKFCSVAKPKTIIFPKKIPGYIEPEGQVLTHNGQKFKFVYTPIEYKIAYDLNKGSINEELKKSYTIRDKDYYPPKPVKEGYIFTGWNPECIPEGSMENKRFIANWVENPILISGKKLNKVFDQLANGKNNINAIKYGALEVDVNAINISSTSTPIMASYRDKVIYINSEYPIYCNIDMSHAFEDMSSLMDISFLYEVICNENTNIDSLFRNCRCLSNVDAVSNWANGKFKSFKNAFDGTIAVESGRVPDWYRCLVTIKHISTLSFKTLDSITENRIPGEIIYASSFEGYTAKTKKIVIDYNEKEYTFEYDPISYKINYELSGGELSNPKTNYTIEDEDYYPGNPVRPGYWFVGWNRDCIRSGEIGNITLVAGYKYILG